PGRLAQGPAEKSGRAGRMFGFVINLSLPEELYSGGGAWPAARIRGPAPAVNAWQLSQIPNMCEQHAGRADTNRRTLVAGNSGDARDRRRLGAGRRILRPHLLRPRDDAISPPVRADLRLGRLSLPDAQRAIGVRAGRTGGAGLRAERAELRVRPDDQGGTLVYVLGGSVAQGFSADSKEDTWHAWLERLLRGELGRKDLYVFNAAMGAFVSLQEKLSYYLA